MKVITLVAIMYANKEINIFYTQSVLTDCLKPRSCAQFAPGCKFAPRVYFWPCERCFKNLHPGATLHPGADLLHLSRWSILFAPGCKLCT